MLQGYERQETASSTSLPLNSKLQHVLDSIGDLVRTTNIVSINANISAARLHNGDGRVFEQIAREMRSISQRSLLEIQGLHDILDDVKALTALINLAGRQRMLAQKTMKLICLELINGKEDGELAHEMKSTIQLFEESHRTLAASKLNSAEINHGLEQVWLCWRTYKSSLTEARIDRTNLLNNELTALINTTVSQYQALAG